MTYKIHLIAQDYNNIYLSYLNWLREEWVAILGLLTYHSFSTELAVHL